MIFLNRIVCFNDVQMKRGDEEGQVNAIIKHPSMKTVYAITYDAHKRKFI